MSALALVLLGLAPQQFVDRPGLIPGEPKWTECIRVLDLDRDGRLDLFVLNAQGYAVPGDFRAPSPDPLRPDVLLCTDVVDGLPEFRDISASALPEGLLLHGKSAAVGDLDGDGFEDLAIAVAFGARPRLLRRDAGQLRFLDESARLPDLALNSFSVGCGDLDDDGDLDLVFADSGARSFGGSGGRARYFENDGRGHYSDVSERLDTRLAVGQQNVHCIDIDGDLDLDVVIDGKSDVTLTHLNDGRGNFTLDADVVPLPEWAGRNFARDPAKGREHDDDMGTYEIEWGDLDGDRDLDGVYMNFAMGKDMPFRDGTLENRLEAKQGLSFSASTATFSGDTVDDENDLVLLDVDDDGDLDLVVAVLPYFTGPEKLFRNSGTFGEGFLELVEGAFTAVPDATLDLAVADFDGDGDYDVISAQGEIPGTDFTNRYYQNEGPPDTHAPLILRGTEVPARMALADLRRGLALRAWIQDAVVDDGTTFVRAELSWRVQRDGRQVLGTTPMPHVGGGIHRGVLWPVALPGGLVGARVTWAVEAEDPMGNRARSPEREFLVTGAESFGSGVGLGLSAELQPDGTWRVGVSGDRPGVQASLQLGQRSDAGAGRRGAEYVAAEGRSEQTFTFDEQGRAELHVRAPEGATEFVLQAFAPGPADMPRSSPGLRIVTP